MSSSPTLFTGFTVHLNNPLALSIEIMDDLILDHLIIEKFITDFLSHETLFTRNLLAAERSAATPATNERWHLHEHGRETARGISTVTSTSNSFSVSPSPSHISSAESSLQRRSNLDVLIAPVVGCLLPLTQSLLNGHIILRDTVMQLLTQAGRFKRALIESRKFESELNPKLVEDFQGVASKLHKAKV